MSLTEMLAKRQALVEQAKAGTSQFETGVQASVPTNTPPDPLALVHKHLTEKPVLAAVPAPEGAYLFIRLQKLICKGGKVVKPDAHGFYVPQTEDEEKRLKDLEAQDADWVKKVG